jgi:membrane-associated phospholipid phosphatase
MVAFIVRKPSGALEPSPGGLAERLGGRSRTHRPIVSGGAVTFVGYVVITALLIGLGLILTKLLLGGPVGRWDTSVNRWFVTQRTPALNTVTSVGSILGASFTVIGIGLVASIVLAIKRWWREIGLLVAGLMIEFAAFVTTTVLVDRPRPHVPKLEAAATTSSFPSGHTAAAIVLYVSLALVITSRARSATVRALVWVLAIMIPIYVAISRLYRGMHHPTDVMGSVVLGAGSVIFALLACRTAGAVTLDRTTEAPAVATAPSGIQEDP